MVFADVWVGAKDRQWLDGRAVATDEWNTGEPNGPVYFCVHMWYINSTHVLADARCSTSIFALCMRN